MIANQKIEEPRRILVVDDDPDLCTLIHETIGPDRSGVELRFATSVDAAVDTLRSAHDCAEDFDLVLADFLLADSKNGYELREFCKSISPRSHFAMMSAMPLNMAELENDAFLRKPFSPTQCRSFIESHLDR